MQCDLQAIKKSHLTKRHQSMHIGITHTGMWTAVYFEKYPCFTPEVRAYYGY